MVMKHFQYLFRLFVALIAISTARAVYAQQDPLLNIDVIRPDRRFDKLVPLNLKIEKIAGGHKWVEGPCGIGEKAFCFSPMCPTIKFTNCRKTKARAYF